MEAKDEPGSSLPSPSAKKSRRSVQKRVVSVPVGEGKVGSSSGAGESAPPSDSWAWRKYGQKPIKGSPYPRGYYRCSSSKGCPARKQVERSRVDPTTFIVTYSFDHDHSSFVPRNHRHGQSSPAAASKVEKLTDLIAEEPAGIDSFGWFAQIDSGSSPSPVASSKGELFGGTMAGVGKLSAAVFDDCDGFGGWAGDEEEDALFAGLGELPECSVVFRRGFLERQWLGVEDVKRCGIEAEESAAASAAASWCGSMR